MTSKKTDTSKPTSSAADNDKTAKYPSNETTKKASSPPKSSPATASVTTISLLCLICLGIGAMCGYLVFSTIFHHRCADLMDDAEQRFLATEQKLNERYIRAVEGHHNECITQELHEVKVLAEQTKLEQEHSVLVAQLRKQQEAELEQWKSKVNLQSKYIKATVADKMEDIEDLTKRLRECQQKQPDAGRDNGGEL